jgi:hypothetical protein
MWDLPCSFQDSALKEHVARDMSFNPTSPLIAADWKMMKSARTGFSGSAYRLFLPRRGVRSPTGELSDKLRERGWLQGRRPVFLGINSRLGEVRDKSDHTTPPTVDADVHQVVDEVVESDDEAGGQGRGLSQTAAQVRRTAEVKFANSYYHKHQPRMAQPDWEGNMINLLPSYYKTPGLHATSLYAATITKFR